MTRDEYKTQLRHRAASVAARNAEVRWQRASEAERGAMVSLAAVTASAVGAALDELDREQGRS